SNPLVISSSAPVRITSARSGEPALCIAAKKPSAIDKTATNTMTTPAIPMTATAEEPSRCGIVRRLTTVTAATCVSQDTSGLSQGVGDFDAHRPRCRHDACYQAESNHEADAKDHITLWERKR